MKPTRTEIENLAVSFAVAPSSPGHAHCSVWEMMARIGGEAAIHYGIFLAIPFRQRWKKLDAGRRVADSLRRAAK